MKMIEHYNHCTDRYPEKPHYEQKRSTTVIDLEDGEYAVHCDDCGAYVLTDKPSEVRA
jgi:transcription elongation factor Elf1